MLCPRQGANCCYIDNVKLLQDLIKNAPSLRLEPAGRVSPVRGRRGGSVITSLHTSLSNSANSIYYPLPAKNSLTVRGSNIVEAFVYIYV